MARVNEPTRAPEFGDAWAKLEPELRRSLAGAPAHVVDDVLQETSIKLLRVWGSIDHNRPALPLAVTIARNTLRDELRRAARHTHVELSEEARVLDDLDVVVSARLDLARVGSEMTRLTPGQRAALLAELGGAPRPPDSPRVKMLRARARARLRELVAQAGGFVVTGVARLRSTVSGRAPAGAPELGLLAQALVVTVVAAVSGAPLLERPGLPHEISSPPVVAAAEARGTARGPRATSPAAVTGTPRAADAGRAGTAVSPAGRHGGGTPPSSPAPPSTKIPRAHGGTGEEGYVGTEGYSLAGSGGNSAAGHDVAWRYEGEWESPGCVQRLANGQPPGSCEPVERPSAAAEVEAAGRRVGVGTDRRRP